MITLQITSAFDGATVVDLSTATYNAALQRHQLTVGAAGVVPFGTLQAIGGPRGVWLQVAQAIGFAPTFSLRTPAGSVIALPARPGNVWIPQGCDLVIDGGAGSVEFWMWGINDKNYSPLTCCHLFAPEESVPPGPIALGAGNDFSVNSAKVNGGYGDGSIVLRTGAVVNLAGAFHGGGTGNKAISGVFGFSGLPIGSLTSLRYVWENVDGPGGPFFLPPGGPSVQTPYMNLIVDFDPLGAGDLRVISLLDDSLSGLITAAIGTYANNGSNVLTYSWDSSKDVLIVLAPPNPVPGGVVPNVSVGPSWPENSYRWADLVAANPTAILVDAFPADGGLPAGAVMPSILLVSGDSGNVTKSGKKITALDVNGASVL